MPEVVDPRGTAASWTTEHDARRAAEEAVTRLSRLQAATAALLAARTPDEVAEVALGAGLGAMGGARGAVLLGDATGRGLVVLRSEGVPADEAERLARGDEPGPVSEALRSGAPIFVEDRVALAGRWPALGTTTAPPRNDATVALPLAIEGRTLGVLAIGFDGPRPFLVRDRAFAATVAGLCAQALDRARLLVLERSARAEAVAAQRRLALLDDLSALLGGTFEEFEMLAGAVQLAVPAASGWAAVYLGGEGGGRLEPAHAAGDAAVGARARARLEQDPLGRLAHALRGGPAAHLDDLPGAEAVAVVPLAARGRDIGALAFASAEPGRRFGAPDLALLEDVARRTAQAVDHARLYGEAQAAVRAREEFLHVASHELRGPLGTLRLAVQLLAREVRIGKDVEPRIRTASRQADRLARLADALLDVSRITAGPLELAREDLDAAALVRDAVAHLAEEAAEVGSAIALVAPEPVPLHGDHARLDQVITNLLSNALKYGGGQPIDVGVRAAGGRVVITVRDRGIGIAPEDQARIFGRFERAVSARNYTGLGLGLWIVERIVVAHGGCIAVDSTPGEGATFTVELQASPGARPPGR
jgi:signal transduction histidine kinase